MKAVEEEKYAFPRGWFLVSFSEELAVGQVVPMRYFASELVLFRTETGEARVLDAYCPHMGAHLGRGGKVEGGNLRCPFHRWAFDGNGRCVDVPYAAEIPPRARVRSWPIRERNGMIFVWHDPEELAPEWEIPVIEEYATGEYSPWDHRLIELKTRPLAVVESVAAPAHFGQLHEVELDLDSFGNTFEDHTVTLRHAVVAHPLAGGRDRLEFCATYYGPAYQVTWLEGGATGVLVHAHTPIEAGRLHLRFAVSLSKGKDRAIGGRYARRYIASLMDGYQRIVPHWERKRFIDQGEPSEGDPRVLELRRWYDQFLRPRE